MGRTLQTTTQILRTEQTAFGAFRRTLRREDQLLFDRLFALANRHVAAISQANHALPFEAILLAMLGLSPVTAISGSVAALCNIGPGLGPVIGPAGNYASLSDEVKWVLSAAMLFGRLEFLSVLVVLTPSFWSR